MWRGQAKAQDAWPWEQDGEMKILFLHGWNSKPVSVKPTFLAQYGLEVIYPTLNDNDFDEALRVEAAPHVSPLISATRPTR